MWDTAPGLSPAAGKAGMQRCIPRAGSPGILTLQVPVLAEETNRGKGVKGESTKDNSQGAGLPHLRSMDNLRAPNLLSGVWLDSGVMGRAAQRQNPECQTLVTP